MSLLVDQPALGNGLHPGTAERNDLAADEVAVVEVAERAETLCQPASRGLCHGAARGGVVRRLCSSIYLAGWHPIFSEYGALQWEIKFHSFRGESTLADDKTYKAEYLGSGTFLISKPKRKKAKMRQTRLHNPQRGSRK